MQFGAALSFVIPALGAGIHALGAAPMEGVNARTKSGHDGVKWGGDPSKIGTTPWR